MKNFFFFHLIQFQVGRSTFFCVEKGRVCVDTFPLFPSLFFIFYFMHFTLFLVSVAHMSVCVNSFIYLLFFDTCVNMKKTDFTHLTTTATVHDSFMGGSQAILKTFKIVLN